MFSGWRDGKDFHPSSNLFSNFCWKRRGADRRRGSGGKFASGRIYFNFLKILKIVVNSKDSFSIQLLESETFQRAI